MRLLRRTTLSLRIYAGYAFDLGIALIISVLFQKVIFVAMVFLLRGFVSAGLDTGSTLFTVLNYTFSNISTYMPQNTGVRCGLS